MAINLLTTSTRFRYKTRIIDRALVVLNHDLEVDSMFPYVKNTSFAEQFVPFADFICKKLRDVKSLF